MTGPRPTRRRVLAALGLAGAAGVAAACGTSSTGPSGTGPTTAAPSGPPGTAGPSSTATPGPGPYVGDLQAVALVVALQNLTVELYDDAVDDARRGRFGTTPDVVTAFLTGAAVQHREAARTGNDLLVAGGRAAVTGTPLTVAGGRRAALAGARVPADLLVLALELETSLAATLVARLGEISGPGPVAAAARTAPVAAMHAATAAFLLGRTPGTPVGPGGGALARTALTA